MFDVIQYCRDSNMSLSVETVRSYDIYPNINTVMMIPNYQ